VRLLVRASDISITLARASETSIMNVFPATVEEVTRDGDAHVTTRLMVGATPMIGKITRKSATTLGLQPGMSVFVQIKSVALLS
jgi:molybdate transport system ATP-binding protein